MRKCGVYIILITSLTLCTAILLVKNIKYQQKCEELNEVIQLNTSTISNLQGEIETLNQITPITIYSDEYGDYIISEGLENSNSTEIVTDSLSSTPITIDEEPVTTISDETVTDNTVNYYSEATTKTVVEEIATEVTNEVEFNTYSDAEYIANIIYNEARGVGSITEQACVAWTILNRVDAWGSSIYAVCTLPNQFAYKAGTPIVDEYLNLANDVISRWYAEKNGVTDVGRVLPKEYIYFSGWGGHNHFRANYDVNSAYWDYSLPSPYAN